MIQENILELVKYGLSTGLVDPEDKVYTINRLLELFQVDEIEDAVFEKVENLPAWTQEEAEGKLEGILAEMMDYAYENGLMAENSIVYKDLFDTKIMGCLVPEPSSVRKTFRDLYEHTSPLAATDYFYKLSCDSNYIRRQRIKKDRKWTTDTEFGTLDITINLSKPEKDPKAIAAAKKILSTCSCVMSINCSRALSAFCTWLSTMASTSISGVFFSCFSFAIAIAPYQILIGFSCCGDCLLII